MIDFLLHTIFSWWIVLALGVSIAIKKRDSEEGLYIVGGASVLSLVLYMLS